jgi:hypothetical protein
MIYKTLKIDRNRLRYCQKTNEKLIETINKKKPKTMNELADIWYAESPNEDRNRHYNCTRYHGLNLHATFTKWSELLLRKSRTPFGRIYLSDSFTVEFRLFNSTTHAGEIKAY